MEGNTLRLSAPDVISFYARTSTIFRRLQNQQARKQASGQANIQHTNRCGNSRQRLFQFHLCSKGFSSFTSAPTHQHTSKPAKKQANKQTNKQVSFSYGQADCQSKSNIKTIKVPYIDPQSWDQGFAGSQEYIRKSVV